MKSVKSVCPPNLGWIESTLEQNEVDFLWEAIKRSERNMKSDLAGNIDSSYKINDKNNWFFYNVLMKLGFLYEKEFANLGWNYPTPNKHPYYLDSFWVNYQKQHEFNPIHHHKGVYSFVIFLQIPTNYEDQKKNPIASSNTNAISNFNFLYQDILGRTETYTYEMSKRCEGIILFFPSQLSHGVNPFYNCEEDRITISGNICLDTREVML